LALSASAQVVRFETSVGDFDMVINPTKNQFLNDYADNFIRYVENDNYLGSWINRAATNQDGGNFVLQMGGFFSNTKRVPPMIDSTRPVQTFAPVEGRPAAALGLSNTIGTVALALPGDGQGGTNRDAGTSSFFVNLTDNSFLDPDFTVFAAISDMTTINKIMALTKVDKTSDPIFGAGDGNLGFSDVPVQDNGFQVFINRAFVISDTLATAKALAGVQSVMAASAAGSGSASDLPALTSTSGDLGGAASGSSLGLGASSVPEPASCFLAAAGAVALAVTQRRKRA
jgi:cyclophilin family peptidyl-prolyl cis-trans isomerase